MDCPAHGRACEDAHCRQREAFERRCYDLEKRRRYCTQCGVIDKISDDGTCWYCGCDSCDMQQLREHLREWEIELGEKARK